MRVNKDCGASSGDFWYDLSEGGYLNPDVICSDKDDAKRVKDAVAVIKDFQSSCEKQIPEFLQ
jgi:hypothetical protein